MPEVRLRHFLPALMGSLHQQRADGELVLEQNDGTRRLHWEEGNLRYLRSDAVGEQFGNFLIRRGVLDMAALKELLSDGEGARVGDRVVQWGLMTVSERDERLSELLGSVLLHAMEHPILKLTWNPGIMDGSLAGGDLQFRLDHRSLVWSTFQNAKVDHDLVEMFRGEPDWRWGARPDLLESLSDLPLTPTLAYALSLLGTEPLGFETMASLTGLPPEEAARLVATLWSLGGLSLVRGELPLLASEPSSPPRLDLAFEPEPQVEEAPEAEPIVLLQEDEEVEPPLAPLPPPRIEVQDRAFHPLPEIPDPHEPTPSSLPLMPSAAEEGALSARERARRLTIKAKSYLMQSRTSEAIRALEQAIKLDGDSPSAYEAWLTLGRLRLANPAWSTRAVEALQVASRLNSRAAEPWVLMGELYHRKGFRANAQGCFRRALELDPSVALPSDHYLEEAADLRAGHGLMDRLKAALGKKG